MNIPLIRALSQQLISPQFNKPEEVVAWMGAMQAQDFGMAKSSVALRMRSKASDLLSKVNKSLDKGKIIRVHVMRPTWQLISPEDYHWMVDLSRDSNERLVSGYLKTMDTRISDTEYEKAMDVFRSALSGGKTMQPKHLSKYIQESGLPSDYRYMTGYLWRAETRKVLCSGTTCGSSPTYALVDERIAPQESIGREEALSRLAANYFRSHSPASVEDFQWWSGLSILESRKAVKSIEDLLEKKNQLYLYKEARVHGKLSGTNWMLPAFDEYLVGYTDRTHVLPKEVNSKIITKNGIFHPAIAKEGQIVGSWGWKGAEVFR